MIYNVKHIHLYLWKDGKNYRKVLLKFCLLCDVNCLGTRGEEEESLQMSTKFMKRGDPVKVGKYVKRNVKEQKEQYMMHEGDGGCHTLGTEWRPLDTRCSKVRHPYM